MKSFKYPLLGVGILYFSILLAIALFVRDIPLQPSAFDITHQNLIESTGMHDPASFATAAIDIAENGWISTANEWILNLWPPGFILLEALILKVFGADAPVILVLQILAASLFSFVLVLLYELLSTCVNGKFAFILPLIIFAFPVSRLFLLEPTGVVLGESFAIGLFLLSILLSFCAVEKKSVSYAVYVGICLALSAYFRSQFELILLALTGWGVLLIITSKLIRLRNTIEPELVKSVIKTIAVALLVANATTMPWRAYHWFYQGNPSWVQTGNLVFENSVKTSDQLNNASGGFLVAGGGNLVCRIDPTTCGDTANAKKLFVKTFVENPVEWYALKFDVIGKYWFSSVTNWGKVKFEPTRIDMVTNLLLLIALIAIIVLLFSRRLRMQRSWPLLLWFNSALFSSYLLIFTIIHFEVRYFYFPKIAGIFMVVILAGMYLRPVNKLDTSI
jgi:hypothetical protein